MPIYLLQHSAFYHQASTKKPKRTSKFRLASITNMASTQRYKAAEQTCYQGQYYGIQPSLVNTETQCANKTQTYYSESGLAKTETAQSYTQTNNPRHTHGLGLGGLTHSHSNGTAAASGCRTSKKRSEHGGLFQKLKDRLSGDSSCSSSDSESDDEHWARSKPSC